MSAIEARDCPLCLREAVFQITSYGERHYRCPHCKEFVITPTAEGAMPRYVERRDAYARLAAKGWDDSLLVIRMAPRHPTNNDVFEAKFESRRVALNLPASGD